MTSCRIRAARAVKISQKLGVRRRQSRTPNPELSQNFRTFQEFPLDKRLDIASRRPDLAVERQGRLHSSLRDRQREQMLRAGVGPAGSQRRPERRETVFIRWSASLERCFFHSQQRGRCFFNRKNTDGSGLLDLTAIHFPLPRALDASSPAGVDAALRQACWKRAENESRLRRKP
jgi:hypothetical protein